MVYYLRHSLSHRISSNSDQPGCPRKYNLRRNSTKRLKNNLRNSLLNTNTLSKVKRQNPVDLSLKPKFDNIFDKKKSLWKISELSQENSISKRTTTNRLKKILRSASKVSPELSDRGVSTRSTIKKFNSVISRKKFMNLSNLDNNHLIQSPKMSTRKGCRVNSLCKTSFEKKLSRRRNLSQFEIDNSSTSNDSRYFESSLLKNQIFIPLNVSNSEKSSTMTHRLRSYTARHRDNSSRASSSRRTSFCVEDDLEEGEEDDEDEETEEKVVNNKEHFDFHHQNNYNHNQGTLNSHDDKENHDVFRRPAAKPFVNTRSYHNTNYSPLQLSSSSIVGNHNVNVYDLRGTSSIYHSPASISNRSTSSPFNNSVNLLTLLKTPEKIQGERMKRLRSRWVEQDSFADTSSQLSSAMSPSTCSLLNGTEQDSWDRLMELLDQTAPKSWSDVFHSDDLDDLVKIGEGVYGEVFQTGGENGDVIKIFPIEGQNQIMDGSRSQMTFHSVFPEVFVSKRLSELSRKSRENRTMCFSQLRRAYLVQGKLPFQFVVQWKVYHSLYISENICLDHLPSDQLWIVLQFEYGGIPLDKFRFNCYAETRSVFEQICLSLAAGEAELQFEHRDLHWGNVLVERTRQDKIRFRVNNTNYCVWTRGVKVTIIDFTVSRMTLNGNTAYVDMSENPEIFGVYDCDYQNEIYRMMRNLNGNDWRAFQPLTNLMWLHYLCDRLLFEVRIVQPRQDSQYTAIYSEMVAVEKNLRDVVQPPKSYIRNELNGDFVCNNSSQPMLRSKNLQNYSKPSYTGAVDFVQKNFYFDSCRMST